MSKVYLEDSTLTGIANAIRTKTGESGTITPANMATEIGNIPSGGGGIDFTTTALDYLCYKGRFLSQLPSTEIIVTNNNKNPNRCFYNINNPGRNIPGFIYNDSLNTLEISRDTASYVFTGTDWLNIPKFDITTYESTNSYSKGSIYLPECIWGITKKDDYLWDDIPMHVVNFFNTFYYNIWQGSTPSGYPNAGFLSICCYRNPTKDIDNFLNNFKPRNWYYTSSYSSWSFYAHLLLGGTLIDWTGAKDITNLCVVDRRNSAASDAEEITSNMFIGNLSGLAHTIIGYVGNQGSTAKDFTFELLNGQPYPVKWKNQVIVLGNSSASSASVSGYCCIGCVINSERYHLPRVFDTTTYEQYKNQHYATELLGYSRYNHASAARTLASLPDTTYGGEYTPSGNQIRFYGSQYIGAFTDEGPISDLTAEEIAVATNKGWTVTLN